MLLRNQNGLAECLTKRPAKSPVPSDLSVCSAGRIQMANPNKTRHTINDAMRLNRSRVALAKNQMAPVLARTPTPKIGIRQSHLGCQSKKFRARFISISAVKRVKHATTQPMAKMIVRFMFSVSLMTLATYRSKTEPRREKRKREIRQAQCAMLGIVISSDLILARCPSAF